MGVDVTNFLWHAYDAGNDLDGYQELYALAESFLSWQKLGGGTHVSALFGRDSAYRSPFLIHGEYKFFHVHMAPARGTPERAEWDTRHAQGRKKTSESHLLYVRDGHGNYLLLYHLQEDAHDEVRPDDERARRLLGTLKRIAEEWMDDRIPKDPEGKGGWVNLIEDDAP